MPVRHPEPLRLPALGPPASFTVRSELLVLYSADA